MYFFFKIYRYKEMEEIIISVFDRFYDKDVIIQKTFEIETTLYDRLEFLSENIYDASISKLINACIDDLVETEDVKLYPKDGNELYLKHSLLLRRYSLDNLETLKKKYDLSVYKLINIAIHRSLEQLDKENK